MYDLNRAVVDNPIADLAAADGIREWINNGNKPRSCESHRGIPVLGVEREKMMYVCWRRETGIGYVRFAPKLVTAGT
jgi:hypothetical protein